MRILLIQTAFVGDLFLAIPLMRKLKALPQAQLTLLCRKGLGAPFRELALAHEVIEADKKNSASRREVREKLEQMEWDLIVSPHESPRTALWVSRLKAQQKIGFKKWWNGWVFDRRIAKPYHWPDALRQMSLLEGIDSETAKHLEAVRVSKQWDNPVDLKFHLEFLKAAIPAWASMSLRNEHPRLESVVVHGDWLRHAHQCILIAPGSVWPTKRWTVEGFTKIASELTARGERVVLLGTPAEKPACDQIQEQVPAVLNLAGQTTLLQTLRLMKEAKLLICNDSGASHMAAAMDLPTLSIFGPTTLAQGFRPWQQKVVVAQKDLPCRPCGKHGAKKCPIGTHECMKGLSAQEVQGALKNLLF